jgi:hypothetical protein
MCRFFYAYFQAFPQLAEMISATHTEKPAILATEKQRISSPIAMSHSAFSERVDKSSQNNNNALEAV